jgi:chorismate synthase
MNEMIRKALEQACESEINRLSYDRYVVLLSPTHATFKREWKYDDWDMNEDSGRSSAKVQLPAFEELVERLLRERKVRGTLHSVNSFHSHAKQDFGAMEDVDLDEYVGQALIEMTLQDSALKFRFLPSLDRELRVRLQQGKDYL